MLTADPSPDWYVDHILLAAEPGGGLVGPARQRRAAWQRTWLRLSADPTGSDVDESLRDTAAPAICAAQAVASGQGFVLTRAQARSCGLDEATIRRLVRSGSWTTVRRGVLTPLRSARDAARDVVCATDPAIAAAAVVLVRPGTRISHESAAIANGLPVLAVPARPIVTHPEVRSSEGCRSVLMHAAPCAPAEQASWFGAPTTSVARLVVDIARSGGPAAGIVVADAALRERLTTRSELTRSLDLAIGWPGVRAARLVVGLAKGLAESALESVGRLVFHQAGLPAPELQQWIQTDHGRFRVDMLWPRARVVVELDGAVKYTTPDALWHEKLRQESIERAGYIVVRLSWNDVTRHPDESAARVHSALTRGAARS